MTDALTGFLAFGFGYGLLLLCVWAGERIGSGR